MSALAPDAGWCSGCHSSEHPGGSGRRTEGAQVGLRPALGLSSVGAVLGTHPMPGAPPVMTTTDTPWGVPLPPQTHPSALGDVLVRERGWEAEGQEVRGLTVGSLPHPPSVHPSPALPWAGGGHRHGGHSPPPVPPRSRLPQGYFRGAQSGPCPVPLALLGSIEPPGWVLVPLSPTVVPSCVVSFPASASGPQDTGVPSAEGLGPFT